MRSTAIESAPWPVAGAGDTRGTVRARLYAPGPGHPAPPVTRSAEAAPPRPQPSRVRVLRATATTPPRPLAPRERGEFVALRQPATTQRPKALVYGRAVLLIAAI
ncbi:hypothetical protein Sfulv_56390 [Streptomyces fulvorobeus]|uniref:Uncharacterized protein n=1 Tax=Streptomyces fulvorobeus TaxID=284028 RepID=A0A7J0CEJ2_9ACTN|nr:hypothetical protein Sfulv_56390 [Streptomyces fulvorobeus]